MESDMLPPAELDPARQKHAQAYALKRRRLSLVSISIALLSLTLMLRLGLDKWLRHITASAAPENAFVHWQPKLGWFPIKIAFYFLILTLLYEMFTFPHHWSSFSFIPIHPSSDGLHIPTILPLAMSALLSKPNSSASNFSP